MSDERLRATLETIRDMEGKVCDEFTVCDHRVCGSSYNAWALAEHALDHPRSVPGCELCQFLDGRLALVPHDEAAAVSEGGLDA